MNMDSNLFDLRAVAEFGQGRLSGKYYTSPSGQSYPSAACSESIQSISTIPEVINMTVDKSEASEGFCSEVRFTIQPVMLNMLEMFPVCSVRKQIFV